MLSPGYSQTIFTGGERDITGSFGRHIALEEEEKEEVEDVKREEGAFRPFVPDPMEETNIGQPDRGMASFHDASEISRGQQAALSTLERPKPKSAQVMYTRPGFDNVPSY